MFPTDPYEITKIINSLKPSSAPGWDKIDNQLLKKGKHILTPAIAHLCNLSLSSGVVPDSFKSAYVCPIHKTGDPLLTSNYRPISLLSSISKIIEKVVNKRLLAYLEAEGLLSQNQYGFRNNRSTDVAVANLANCVTENLDAGNRCAGVFLDLAKAFDTVSRPILLRKLEALGIRGVALEWFHSYLSNRQQRVKVCDVTSELSEVEFGVPQGSVLGPTLFLVYINSLCSLQLPQTEIFSFADDTALIFHGKSWKDVSKIAETNMKIVSEWLQNNLLTLNTDKTKLVPFYISKRSAPDNDFSVNIHQCQLSLPAYQGCNCPLLEQVAHIKYLGICIDSGLTWNKQIDTLCGRLRKMMHIFKRLRSVTDVQTIRLVYKALCQSIISYCVVSWGAACKTNLIRLERAQRALLKIAYRKPYRHPTESLYKEVDHLTVRQIYISSSIQRFHKTSFSTITLTHSNRRTVWSSPRVRTSFGRRSYNYVGPYLYTKLNKQLNIVSLTRGRCKKKVVLWLLTLNYNETESLLITPT